MPAQNNIVGEVGLLVKPIDPGFDAAVQRIIDRIEKNAKLKFEADTSQAEQAAERLSKKVGDVGTSWQQAALEVAGFSAALYGVKAAIDGVINKFAGLFDQLSKAKAGFTAILGSERAGKGLLDEIREFARISPFVTEELVNYSQQLLGVGKSADSIVPLLKDVGNIVSSVGGDTQNLGRVLFTLTQIQTIGRLTGQDAMQLQSALIPITKMLSSYLGKTTAEVKKLQENGQISAESVFAAISASGKKVEGAMDGATRNIAGAKAIFSDSVKIMLQDSPLLQKVNEDIYKGILKLSEFISTPKFQEAFTSFQESAAKLYESLKPVGAALAQFGGSGSIATMTAFADILKVLAGVINSFPEPVLRLIGVALASMAAVRTPLLLLKYAEKLKDIGNGLFGLASAKRAAEVATQAETSAIDAQTRSLGANTTATAENLSVKQRIASMGRTNVPGGNAAVGGGLLAAGMIASDGNGGERDAVGGILTGAGIGAAAAGPIGAAVGGAIGAGLAIMNANKEVERATKEAAEKAAQTYVDNFNKSIVKEFGDVKGGLASTDALNTYGEELTGGEKVVNTYTDYVGQLNSELKIQESILDGMDNDGSKAWDKQSDAVWDLKDRIKGATGNLQQFTHEQEVLIAGSETATQVLGPLANKLAALNKLREGAIKPVDVTSLGTGIEAANLAADLNAVRTGQRIASTQEEINFLIGTFDHLGISIADGMSMTVEAIDSVAKIVDGMTTAFSQAREAVIAYNKEIKDSKDAGTAVFAPFIEEAKNAIGAMEEAKAVNKAFGSLFTEDKKTNAITVTGTPDDAAGVGLAILTSGQKRYSETLFETKSEAEALFAANERMAGEFNVLKETLGLTEDKFKEFLKTAGLMDIYTQTVKSGAKVSSRSIQEMASEFGVSMTEIKKVFDLKGTTDLSQVISTPRIDAMAHSLIGLKQHLKLNPGDVEGWIAYHTLAADLKGEIDVLTPTVKDAKDAIEKLNKVFTGNDAEQAWTDAISRAHALNKELGTLFIVSDKNTLELTKTADDFGTVIASILTSAQALGTAKVAAGGSQFQGAETAARETWQQFELLQLAMHMTDAEFLKFLDSMGAAKFYTDALALSGGGLVGTLSEVSKQVGLSVEDLAHFAGVVGKIDPDMKIVINIDTVDAIKRIEELETKWKNTPFSDGMTPDQLKEFNEYTQLKADQANGAGVFNPDTKKQEKEIADAAQKEWDRVVKEQKAAAEKAAKAAEAWAKSVQNAQDTFAHSLEAVAESIVAAADAWVGSLKERTQYDQAVSTSRLTKNANHQAKDAEELLAGMADLRARGITDETMKALGIDNISDLKQVKKLTRSSNADLAGLSSAVASRGEAALSLAVSEEDKRARDNIAAGILSAAQTLDIDFSKKDATSLAANINITPGMDAEAIAAQILSILSAGHIA